jgi:hypothetical protein
MARRLTHAEALAAWRVDGELRGGHTVQQTLGFIGALMDLEDEQAQRRAYAILGGDFEPRWVTRLRARFGR